MKHKNLEKKYMLNVYKRFPIYFVKGKGMYLYDNKGKKYLDFLSGIAVNIFGYANSVLIKAIHNQSKKFTHVSNLFYTDTQVKLSKKLATLFGDGKVFLSNSGAEANECAIKFARKWGTAQNKNKYEIISFDKSFHGRTMATLSATAQEQMHEGYFPLISTFKYAEFNNIASVKKLLSSKTCACLLEIIQGEGGVRIANKNFVKELSKLCKQKNVLLILDEIQVGLGRTGKFFAYDHYGIKPDIVTLAKPLGGGLPLGATIVDEKISHIFSHGSHGSTFGGNPVACAAALKVLSMLDSKRLKYVSNIGDYFLSQLHKLKIRHKVIKNVRGKGLILGVELKKDASGIVNACLENGFIINVTQKNVVRFLPPFIVTKKEIDGLIKFLDNILYEF